MTIRSYPSVFAIGHRAIKEIFDGPVSVSEKVDGSCFGFGVIDGELQCRSKGKQLILDAPEKMFIKAVETVRKLQPLLTPGWTYYAEFLGSPKHNTLCYSRIPKDNIILFDVMISDNTYLEDTLKDEADRIGLECVDIFFQGKVEDFAQFKELLERDSALGGTKIEGFVVKRYDLFTMEKKVAMGKYVREDFQEQNKVDFRKRNPTRGDTIQILIAQYGNEARFRKCVQHLREQNLLEGSPKDIGLLIREVPADILKECEDEIKETLFKEAWSSISRGITHKIPSWYKDELAKSAFEVTDGQKTN